MLSIVIVINLFLSLTSNVKWTHSHYPDFCIMLLWVSSLIQLFARSMTRIFYELMMVILRLPGPYVTHYQIRAVWVAICIRGGSHEKTEGTLWDLAFFHVYQIIDLWKAATEFWAWCWCSAECFNVCECFTGALDPKLYLAIFMS